MISSAFWQEAWNTGHVQAACGGRPWCGWSWSGSITTSNKMPVEGLTRLGACFWNTLKTAVWKTFGFQRAYHCWWQRRHLGPDCPLVFASLGFTLKLLREGFSLASPGDNHGRLHRQTGPVGNPPYSCRRKRGTPRLTRQTRLPRFSGWGGGGGGGCLVGLNRMQTSPPEPDSAKGTEGGGYWRSPACGLQRGPAP